MITLNKNPIFAGEYKGERYKSCENCSYIKNGNYCNLYKDEIEEDAKIFKYSIGDGCFGWSPKI